MISLGLSWPAHADSHEAEADVEAGRALSAPCVACHGDDGNSAVPSYPSIAGQNYRYLVRQMQMIRDGERPAPLMAGQMDNYSDQDIANLAAFYASQAAKVGQAVPESVALGEAIYRGGLLPKQVAACTLATRRTAAAMPWRAFPACPASRWTT